MGSYILRARPDADQYILMSTLSDRPAAAGTRDEVFEATNRWVEAVHEMTGPRIERGTQSALDAAAEHGTSSIFGSGGWDDDAITVTDDEFGLRTLPRDNVPALYDALVSEEGLTTERLAELTEPFDNEPVGA